MKLPIRLLLFVGLPVLTVTAATLYYLNRKEKDFDKFLKTRGAGEKEIMVPVSAIGILIGRNGANIREIQEKTNTRINFKDFEEHKEYRTCQIRGNAEGLLAAERLIFDTITAQSRIKTVEMWVPESARGRIMGRCGDNIRQICRLSNASVTFDPMTLSDRSTSQKLIIIKGTDEEIAKAKELVKKKVEEEEEAREKMKNTFSNRSPRVHPKNLRNGQTVQIEDLPKEELYEKLVPITQGNMLHCYVSAVANPNEFWLQMISPSATDLDFLVEKMTEFYDNEENQEMYKVDKVSKGQILACKMKSDGKWYRVEVIKVLDESPDDIEVDVFYVDYGDAIIQKMEDIRKLKSDFLSLRFQAIEATIEGIAPPSGDFWTEEETSHFMDLVYVGEWKVVMAQVVGYKKKHYGNHEGSSVPCVKLFNAEGYDIAEQMIMSGKAVACKPTESEEQVESTSTSPPVPNKT